MTWYINRAFGSIVVLVLTLIPFWFWLGARSFLSPEGFFQEFFVLGLGVYFLGFAQIVFLVIGALIALCIWSN